MLRVNSKDTRTTSLTLTWFLSLTVLHTVVDSRQANIWWVAYIKIITLLQNSENLIAAG